MLQRLGIRGKILAVVAVPILVLLTAVGFLTFDAANQLSRAGNTTQLIDVLEDGREFADAFRAEGDYASNYLSAWTDRNTQLQTSVALVNQQRQIIADGPPAVAARVDEVLAGGQETDEGLALGLDGARAVRPDTSAAGLPTWPSPDEVERAGASYEAMSNALQQIDASEVEDALLELRLLVQAEGERTVTYLTESAALQEQFQGSTSATDEAWQSLQNEFDRTADTPDNAALLTAVAAIESAIAQLEGIRESVRERSGAAQPTFSFYFSIAQNVVDLTGEVSLQVEDAVISRQLEAFGATDRLVHEVQVEANRVDRLIRTEEFRGDALVTIREQFALTNFLRDRAASVVDALEEGSVELPPGGAESAFRPDTSYNAIRNGISTGFYDLVQAGEVGWEDNTVVEVGNIEPFTADTLQLAAESAEVAQEETLLQSILTVVGAIVAVIASLFIALLIARRIVGPLRRLTTTATAVRQELPRLVERVALPGETVDVSEVQIPVESSDEVGRLAEAFNSVNAATLAIAGEQAALRGSISEMFVNVARRDQVLLNRQLASIDDMERTEQDANTLTRLFALDHLATRMRRNSESLLVLAGIDTGRRLRRPMPLSDVIRTASSEIELYERVEIELDADPAMVGHSALTAAHLFAELLENATVFSDPGTPVVVRTAERDGNYVVEVVDGGIGMTSDEVKEANARVASTAASEILGAQRLGLFVVGRIARRVGAQVEIVSSEREGTTATVTMPPSLFDSSARVDSSHTSDETADAATGAPTALVSHDSDDDSVDSAEQGMDEMRRAGASPASVGTYAPAVVQGGSSLSGRGTGGPSVDDMIAADAAASPAGPATEPGDLTQGTTSSGLPSRRRPEEPGPTEEANPDTANVMGLPSRATSDQMSALEAEATDFSPVVASNEVSPQSAEERAAMFRGFRARGEGEDAVAGGEVEPDAESLGQAARRGAVPPESLPGFGDRAASTIPALEPDEDEPAAPELESADARHDEEPSVSQSPLISTGYQHDRGHAPMPATSNEIPQLEDDEPQVPAPIAHDEPAEDSAPASAGVERVSLTDEVHDRVHPAGGEHAPASSEAAANASSQEQTGRWAMPAVDSEATSQEPPEPTPSLDDVIGFRPDDNGDDKAGFFGRLFGRGKNEETPSEQPSARPTPTFQAPPEPTPPQSQAAPTPAPLPSWGEFQPERDDDSMGDATSASSWTQERAATPPKEDQAEEEPTTFTPAESAVPYNAGAPGTPAPHYSPDQLARPQGWETAGASALEAARPDTQSTYTPVVDIQPADYAEGEGPDVTSEVFSELSSLSAQRPKVEKTSAGLAKRRAEDAPPVEVKPVDEGPVSTPSNRDADEMRKRFSSFYSGTQRARRDVAEMDGQAQHVTTKD